MGYDFGGYTTRYNVKCTDGRTIRNGAFDEFDGKTVPLVWHHLKNSPDNVLGNVYLEKRDDGVYGYGTFNNTPSGKRAKELVTHGDINGLSIHANHLIQRGGDVLHGRIVEVSLVMAGANSGAYIDQTEFRHSYDDPDEIEDAIIYSGEVIHMDLSTKTKPDLEDLSHEDSEGSLRSIFDTLSEKQKNVVYAMLAAALSDNGEMEQGDDEMKHNVFEPDDREEGLTHEDIEVIFQDAQRVGSLKQSILMHADDYGITNIEALFPDAKNTTIPPEWIKRKTEWVDGVINGARHTPFSRIKSMTADITLDTARAKGYIKGNRKKEEFFAVAKRVTTPTTIYKKQKLDRDDIIDITDFDVVRWIKGEMRMMLNEEIARAVLIGDGRDPSDDDKINEQCIRPILKDDSLYVHKITLPAGADAEAEIDALIEGMIDYEGSGTPAMYTTEEHVVQFKLLKDKNGRRIYNSASEVANLIGVSRFVNVPVMKGQKDDDGNEVVGIIVNMADYTIGADRGGSIETFDDFDIDYNQYKYLMETRISGCLTHPKSAVVVVKPAASGPSGSTPSTPPEGGGTRSRFQR